MAAPKISNALLILFEGFNTLDANGPLEVLKKSSLSQHFNVTIASETEFTTSAEGAILKRHVAIDNDLLSNLDAYDLLVVPGGDAGGLDSPVQKVALDTSGPFMQTIIKFAELTPRSESFERILFSICTGAFFLSSAGVFNDGRYCTTHWTFYDGLMAFNQNAARVAGGDARAGKVIPARYVDSGISNVKNQVRIVTSGGISCGMDAALHVVEIRAGFDEARDTADMLDYAWRRTVGADFSRFN